MNKTQFLQLLAEKLSEELPRETVLSNVAYYENYINGELEKGRSIEEIMDELGDPYMIARTILDTLRGNAFPEPGDVDDTVYADDAQGQSAERGEQILMKRNHSCLITAIIIILIVIAVVTVVGSVISFLWPILGPVLLIILIVSIFKDKRG